MIQLILGYAAALIVSVAAGMAIHYYVNKKCVVIKRRGPVVLSVSTVDKCDLYLLAFALMCALFTILTPAAVAIYSCVVL